MLARENPFAAERLERLRLDAAIPCDDLLDRLAALGHRAALVGPHGSGKTTLLGGLAERLEERGFRTRGVLLHRGDRRLAREQGRALLASLGRRDFLLIDGAEQLGRLAWRLLRWQSRAAGGLLVTSHRPGLLPTLHLCRSTPELLQGIVRRAVGEAGAAAVAPVADELYRRHRGNLHEVLRELYLRAAGIAPGAASAP